MKEFQLLTSASSTPSTASRSVQLRSLSIRSLLILLVLLALLPALVTGGWVLSLTERLEREGKQRQLEETSRALFTELDRALAQRALVVGSLSRSNLLDDAPNITPATLRAFDTQARQALQSFEGWLELRSPTGVLLDTRLPMDTTQAEAANAGLALHNSDQVQASEANPSASAYHATLVQPLLQHGKTVLNLSLTVLPVEIQRIVDRQKFGVDWVVTVIDSDGRVVAHHPSGSTYMGRASPADLRERLALEREGLMPSVTLGGVAVMLHVSKSPQGWTFITGMPLEQFEGTLHRAMIPAALGALLLLGLVLLVTVGVSRSIARPISMLKDLAKQMQAGNVLACESTGIRECDEVTRAMSDASLSLRESLADMQGQMSQAVAQTRNAEQRLSQGQRVEALGRLTGGVAHDFNNLLGVISNSAHLIQRRVDVPELQAPIQATLRAVEAGSRLTQHLLRFAGRQPVRPRQLDLTQALPDAGELMKAVLGSRIVLSVAVSPQTQAVFVDPGELELSLINLALNAREAISVRGQVWLHAANATAADVLDLPAGDYVIISVSDEGAGMDEATAKRAFEPFFSGKSSEQGNGLGLSQVYAFCQLAGGTARLDSTPGVGTTVSLLLPTRSNGAAMGERPQALAPHSIACASVVCR